MRIDEIIATSRPCFSFEFFPPRTDDGQRMLEETLAVLRADSPDYVSVTYGAAGSTRERTVEITKWIKQDLGIEAMAHLSCVGEPTERLVEILGEIREAGIDNVLALRGDPPRGETEWVPHPDGLRYSVELIELIKEQFPGFCVGAACFPEVHPEASDPDQDLQYAKRKVDAGASFLITQLFFDNEDYFDFVERARGDRHRRADHRRDHADHELRADQALQQHLRGDDPSRRYTSSSSDITTPATVRACWTSASPTRPSSAPICWRVARPASTSTRSTSRRRRARSWRRSRPLVPGSGRSPALRLLRVRRTDPLRLAASLEVGQEAEQDRQQPARHHRVEIGVEHLRHQLECRSRLRAAIAPSVRSSSSRTSVLFASM